MLKDIRFWLIAVVSAVLLLTLLGNRDLWNPDEPRYALVAREMVEDGDWLVMHRNGEIYPDKPPMYFWAEGLLSKLTGDIDEFTARFPAAISGVAIVILTMLMAGRIFDRKTALLAGIILLATYSFFMHSRSVHMDIPLTLTMLGMFYIMYRLAFGGNPKDIRLWIGFFVLGAIGTLIKGPIGLLVPMFAGFSYLVIRRTAHIERRGKWIIILAVCSLIGMIMGGMKGMVIPIIPGAIVLFLVGGARPTINRGTILGFILFLGIMAAWLVPACISGGGEFTNAILIKQNITRYADAFSHERPFWYFFTRLPMLFLPWIIFLPQAIAMIFRKGALDKVCKDRAIFLLVCVVAIFVFFSTSTSKRHIYLLPALPLMAMLIALYLKKILSSAKSQKDANSRVPKSYRIALSVFAIAIILFAIAMPVLPPILASSDSDTIQKATDVLRVYVPFLTVACVALGLCGAFVLYSCIKHHYRAALVGTVITMMVMVLGTEYYAQPELIDGEKSAREPAFRIAQITSDADEVACYGNPHEGLAYYGRLTFYELANLEHVAEYLQDFSEAHYCIMTEKRLRAFIAKYPDLYADKLSRVYSAGIGGKELVLLSNRKTEVLPETENQEGEE